MNPPPPAPGSRLRRTLSRWTLRRRAALFAEGASWFLPAAAGLGLAWVAADALLALPRPARLAGAALWAAAAAAVLWRTVLRPQWRLRARDVLREAGAERPELAAYLLPAWELRRGPGPGTSAELARAHVESAERRLGGAAPFRLAPGRAAGLRLLAGLAAAAALAVRGGAAARSLAPWLEPPLEALLDVEPGDARVLRGRPVELRAAWREAPREGLTLWVRSAGGGWRLRAWDEPLLARLADLSEELEYRFGWRELRTRSWRLLPVDPPRLRDARWTVFPPPYAAQDPLPRPEGDLELLEGSRIRVEGRPDRPLRRAELRVSELPGPVPFVEEADGRLSASFRPAADTAFRLELEDEEGFADPSPPLYRVKVRPDEPPRAELLSPPFEAEASPREPFRLTYEAADDLGLRRVELEYRVEGEGAEGAALLAEWERGPERRLADADWDLRGFRSGSFVRFRVAATDLRGQRGASKWGAVRVRDFEAEHERLRATAAEAVEALRALAARERSEAAALAALSTAAAPGAAGYPERLEPLERAWAEAAAKVGELARSSEQDPLANPGLQLEYGAVAAGVESARARLPEARARAAAGDWRPAAERRRALAEALERAAESLARGEALQAYQDFWARADRMAGEGARIEERLKEGALDEEGRRRLQESLAELDRELRELGELVESLPQPEPGEAPDARIITVPLGEAQGLAGALQEALRRGDTRKALELARALRESLGKVRRALSEAHEAMAGGMTAPISKELEAALRDWLTLVEEQGAVVQAVSGLEDERTRRRVRAQEALLGELAERQRALRSSTAAVHWPADLGPGLARVETEFREGRVRDAEGLLEAAAARLAPLSPSGAAELRAVLERLRAGVREEAEPGPYREAGQGQARVRRTADALLGRLLELGLEGGPAASLEEAGGEMAAAESALAVPDGPEGLARASRALELLERGMKELERQAEARRRLEAGLRARPAGASGVRPAGGGRLGAAVGFVELPSAADYRPSPELRKEIMRSLNERIPRSYERPVKDYLRRLSE